MVCANQTSEAINTDLMTRH